MYFKFSDFYKRDVYFRYADSNVVEQGNFDNGVKIKQSEVLYYNVDKIDSYLTSYDVLPTFGPRLVITKFKEIFEDINEKEIQFFPAIIRDSKDYTIEGFYTLNILHCIPCLDFTKSIVKKTSYGGLRIDELHILPNSLDPYNIVRMEEHRSFIIVTQKFKQICEHHKLKGFYFKEI